MKLLRNIFYFCIFIILVILTHIYFNNLYRIDRLQKKIDLNQQRLTYHRKILKHLKNEKKTLDETISKLNIENQIENIRSLNFKIPPQYKKLSKKKLRNFIKKEFKEELPPREINKMKKVMYVLGFLPKNYNIEETLVALFSEQVGAFYKVEEKALYTLPDLGISSNLQRTIMAHELVHALQDQYFDIKKISKKYEKNDDTELAIHALIEGDATYVMQKFYLKNLSFKIIFDLFSIFFLDQKEFDKAPDIIKENLLFPYLQGLKFVTFLYQQGGWQAINKAYQDLPTSTEQILHPDKYLAGEKPVLVAMPEELNSFQDYSLVEKNTLGEFNINHLLKKYLPSSRASKASHGWAGDTFIVLEKEGSDDYILIWKTVWDSNEDANEFFKAYKRFIKGKYHKIDEVSTEDNSSSIMEKEDQYVFIYLDGTSVDIIEIPDKRMKDFILETLKISPKTPLKN